MEDLQDHVASELTKIKADTSVCNEVEVKDMEKLEISVTTLGALDPKTMSKLAVHVIYDRISRVCNFGDLDDALAD